MTTMTITTPDSAPAGSAGRAKVWDPFVRLFHWSLVAAVATAAATGFFAGSTWISIHAWAGAAMAALVVARIVWGFAGTSYARFSAFIPAPRSVLEHLRGIFTGGASRHLGHNPLGALMIFALLAVTLALAASGAIALGGMLKSGPLAFATGFATGRGAREVHEMLAWALVALVALHVAGGLFEGRRTRDNLVRAMVTGTKPARGGDHAAPRVRARPVLAAALTVVLLGGSATALASLASRPPLGAPSAPLDLAYAEECGACHMPYHPSLLPRASWQALFATLGDHFGEDASLPAETVASLQAYVTANAAEAFDTLPANVFRRTGADAPYSITATPFWTRTHRGIDDAVFRSRAVASRGNCAACHRDAGTGRFNPTRISIPKEAFQ
jgi:cytochrome b